MARGCARWVRLTAGHRPRAIVVGAGFAGLSAARELDRLGFATVVLEARDRVGGRVWSMTLSNGAMAELGGEWIEDDHDTLYRTVSSLGLELLPTGVDYRRREAVGTLAASIEEQEGALEVARAARAAIADRAAAGATLGSFLRTLALSDRQRATLRARLQGTCATDLDRVALRAAGPDAFTAGSGRYSRVAGGNQSIADEMAKRLPDVRLGQAVGAVVQTSGGIEIRGTPADRVAGGPAFRVEADAAVIAVPAPVAAGLDYSPALPPPLLEALRELPMGTASKLAIPTVDPPSSRARMDVGVPFWSWAALGEGGIARPVLTAFAGSPAAQQALRIAEGDPGLWMKHLRRLNPDIEPAGEPVLAAWGADPLAGGCYSAWDERSCDRAPLLASVVGRVTFAGEHTAGEGTGTMNGALESGLRAAEQVVEMLRP